MNIKNKFAAMIIALLLVRVNADAVMLEPVVLQLKWSHAFQFAGYYAAQELGYFNDAGFAVEIRELAPGGNVVAKVLSGEADFGVGNSSLLVEHQNGRPVNVLAVIFQHDPMVWIANRSKGVYTLDDLVGRTVMMEPLAGALKALLVSEGINLSDLNIRSHSFDYRDLIEGSCDAISGYSSFEPYYLDQAGLNYAMFYPRNAGIDFYGDNLFTSQSWVRRNPEKARNFRDACIKGWEYAVGHPEEVITWILRDYAPDKSVDALRYEADEIIRLVASERIPVGSMNRERWVHVAEGFVRAGVLSGDYQLDGFVFKDARFDVKPWYPHLAVLSLLLMAMVIMLVRVKLWRRRCEMKLREISAGQRQLTQLESILPGVLLRYDSPLEHDSASVSIHDAKLAELLNLTEGMQTMLHARIPSSHHDRVCQVFASAIQRNERFDLRYPVMDQRGNECWIREIAVGVYDSAQRLHGAISVIIDERERSHQETALARLRARLQSAAQATSQADWEAHQKAQEWELSQSLLIQSNSKVINQLKVLAHAQSSLAGDAALGRMAGSIEYIAVWLELQHSFLMNRHGGVTPESGIKISLRRFAVELRERLEWVTKLYGVNCRVEVNELQSDYCQADARLLEWLAFIVTTSMARYLANGMIVLRIGNQMAAAGEEAGGAHDAPPDDQGMISFEYEISSRQSQNPVQPVLQRILNQWGQNPKLPIENLSELEACLLYLHDWVSCPIVEKRGAQDLMFKFILPCRAVHDDQKSDPILSNQAMMANWTKGLKTILIARDNLDAFVVRRLLESLAFDIHRVESCKKGFPVIANKDADVAFVLVDELDEANRRELLQMVKKNPSGRTPIKMLRKREAAGAEPAPQTESNSVEGDHPPSGCPVFAISLAPLAAQRQRDLLASGVSDIITPPLNIGKLRATLKPWLPVKVEVSDAAAAPPSDSKPQLKDSESIDLGVAPASVSAEAMPTEGIDAAVPQVDTSVILDSAYLLERFQNNRRLAGCVLVGFMLDAPKQLRLLKEALGHGNKPDALRFAQVLSNAASGIGAWQSSALIAELQRSLIADETGLCWKLTDDLHSSFKVLKKAISEWDES